MSNKCYIIKLRKTINDNSLDVLEEDGVIRYNAIARAEGISTDILVHFGASGPFEADISGTNTDVTIKGIIGNSTVQSYSGNTYIVTGDTESMLSGIILNEQVSDVTVIIKRGLENLTYIPFTDIELEDIPDNVKYIQFGRATGSVHPGISLSNLNLADKSELTGIDLISTLSNGNINEFLNLPHKESFEKLILINNPDITGNIGALGSLIGLTEFSFNSTGITGNLEDFVRGQVLAGRDIGDIFVSTLKNVDVNIDGQNVGDIDNLKPKRLSWTTSEDNINIIIYQAGSPSIQLVNINITKTLS